MNKKQTKKHTKKKQKKKNKHDQKKTHTFYNLHAINVAKRNI
jgi:hypothetical protein